jgi:hypothetical protein
MVSLSCAMAAKDKRIHARVKIIDFFFIMHFVTQKSCFYFAGSIKKAEIELFFVILQS